MRGKKEREREKKKTWLEAARLIIFSVDERERERSASKRAYLRNAKRVGYLLLLEARRYGRLVLVRVQLVQKIASWFVFPRGDIVDLIINQNLICSSGTTLALPTTISLFYLSLSFFSFLYHLGSSSSGRSNHYQIISLTYI